MMDLSWLAAEAKNIHALFHGFFYLFATVLLLVGVMMEYFKVPLGGVPGFAPLVGRCLVAALLLVSYTEVSNTIADVADALAQRIGEFHQIHLVLEKMQERLGQFTVSWTSAKELITVGVSFITFFLLYISVFIANAGVIFVWTLLYVFSPMLIVLFILPSTAFATKALYRALFEVSAWKIVWSVLATLLWSTALSDINKEAADINFLTVISYNIILAASLLLTPVIVNALMSKGLSSMASSMMGTAVAAATFNPGSMAFMAGKWGATKGKVAGVSAGSKLYQRAFPNSKGSSPPMPKSPPPWLRKKLYAEKRDSKK